MNLFEYGINIFEIATIYYFITGFLGRKEKCKLVHIFLFGCLSFSIVTITNIVFVYEGIFVYISVVTTFIYALLYLEGSLAEKAFVSSFIFIVLPTINAFSFIIGCFVFFGQLEIATVLFSEHREIVVLFSKVLYLLVCYFLVKARQKYKKNFDNKQIIMMMIFVNSLLLINLPLNELLMMNRLNMFTFFIGLIGIMVLLILSILGFFELLKINNQIKEDELKLIVQEDQLEKMLEIKSLNNEIRVLKHDMKHILGYVSMYLKNNEISSAKKIIETYLSNVHHTQAIELTNNATLDYVLNVFKAKCIDGGVNFTCFITSNCLFEISDNELLVLLSNCLSYAYDCCGGKHTIRIDIQDKNNYSFITINNSLDTEFLNNDFYTVAKNKKSHEDQLRIIRNTIENVDGALSFHSADYVSSIRIILNTKTLIPN